MTVGIKTVERNRGARSKSSQSTVNDHTGGRRNRSITNKDRITVTTPGLHPQYNETKNALARKSGYKPMTEDESSFESNNARPVIRKASPYLNNGDRRNSEAFASTVEL